MYLYQYLQAWLASHIKREEGQSMVEYGLILVLIAVVVIGALTLMGGNISSIFDQIANTLGSTGGNGQ